MDNGAGSYRRFLDGDESAFDDIMKELFHSLVFFVDGYVHNTQTAEDIAIDVFAELVSRRRYNFKSSLKTYLFMLGRSRALDHLRHEKKLEFVELSEAEPLPDSGKSLEETVLCNENKLRVRKAVAMLPEDMRVAVHLVFFEDMSYKDAARVMKKSPKQVDNLLFRAKKELRAILGKDGEQFL